MEIISKDVLEKHIALQREILKRDEEMLKAASQINPLPDKEGRNYIEEIALLEDLIQEEREKCKRFGGAGTDLPDIMYSSEWNLSQKKLDILFRIAKTVQAAEMKRIGGARDLAYVVDKIIDESASIHYKKLGSSIIGYIRDTINDTELAMVSLSVINDTCIVNGVKVL